MPSWRDSKLTGGSALWLTTNSVRDEYLDDTDRSRSAEQLVTVAFELFRPVVLQEEKNNGYEKIIGTLV
jgi:hypothetical protein